MRVPMCVNAAAARSYLLRIIQWTNLALAGRTKSQVTDIISAAVEKKELPALESDELIENHSVITSVTSLLRLELGVSERYHGSPREPASFLLTATYECLVVRFCPSAERVQSSLQRHTQPCERILPAFQNRAIGPAFHQSVSLHSAQGLGEHFGGDPFDLSEKTVVAIFSIGQRAHDKSSPLGRNQLDGNPCSAIPVKRSRIRRVGHKGCSPGADLKYCFKLRRPGIGFRTLAHFGSLAGNSSRKSRRMRRRSASPTSWRGQEPKVKRQSALLIRANAPIGALTAHRL